MKKLRKHFMILSIFLLLGVAVLGVSSGAFASTFRWILHLSPPGEASGSSNTVQSSTVESGDSADPISVLPDESDTGQGSSSSVPAVDEPDPEGIDPLMIPRTSVGSNNTEGYREGEVSVKPVGTSPEGKPSGSSSTSSVPPKGPSGDQPTGSAPTSSTPSGTAPPDGSAYGDTPSGGSHHTVGITAVTLDKTEIELKKGESTTLSASVSPGNTTQNKTIAWTSSDESIAMVDSAGKVTAVEGGTATVTATATNGRKSACSVVVSVPATDISLNLSEVPVERGESVELTAELNPADSTDKVLWATSDNSIATVDSSGNITGVSPGTATIIASVEDGSISASCRVTTVVSITQLVLSNEDLAMKKGEEQQLTAQVLPDDTTEDTTVTWSSSDPDVAVVDDSGKVTAVEGGTAIITAQTGTHSAQCAVTVIVPVTGITLDKTELTLTCGTTETLSPILAPADATDRAIGWASSDPNVAAVDDSGSITAVSVGTATVTATTHDGGYTAQCTVSVVIPVTGISLNQTELNLKKGGAVTLTKTITPADATDQAVSWVSSNTGVATVTSSGRVTAVGFGTAIITATTHDGGFTATCQVTVQADAVLESLSGNQSYANEDGSFKLYVVNPRTDSSGDWDDMGAHITLQLSTPVDYDNSTPIVRFANISGYYSDVSSYKFEIYINGNQVYSGLGLPNGSNQSYTINSTGTISTIELAVEGKLRVQNTGHTMGPGELGFIVSPGNLYIAGHQINSIQLN